MTNEIAIVEAGIVYSLKLSVEYYTTNLNETSLLELNPSVNLAAFPEASEANLVDELRVNGQATLSLVAVQNDQIVGHILFSPMTIESIGGQCPLLALGPMAVLPDSQGQGIGSMLVTAGLDQCRRSGVGCVVVLGHPGFYPRFGFQVAVA